MKNTKPKTDAVINAKEKTRLIALRITEAEYRELKHISKEAKITLSDMIRNSFPFFAQFYLGPKPSGGYEKGEQA